MSAVTLPRNIALLDHLTAEQAATVASFARPVPLRPGQALFEVGDSANELFVVIEGTVELTLPIVLDGTRHSVVVEQVPAGSTIGWSCFVPPHKYTLGARAASEGSAASIDRNALLMACRRDPAMGFELMHNLMQTVAHRLGRLHALWVREVQHNVHSEAP